MRGIWPLLVSLVVIPPFLRNLVYDFIAKNRQKIAGRLESCELLKTEDRERFLDK
jgi:predicted DCC family thiol-disulfide oxidoreductase YuxK